MKFSLVYSHRFGELANGEHDFLDKWALDIEANAVAVTGTDIQITSVNAGFNRIILFLDKIPARIDLSDGLVWLQDEAGVENHPMPYKSWSQAKSIILWLPGELEESHAEEIGELQMEVSS